MTDLSNKFAILVVSCDKYSDLWGPFFNVFRRFWPDCPFNVYLLSNKIGFGDPKIKDLLIGEDVSWSDNLRKGILNIKEEYVLLFLDDLLLCDFVKTNEVLKVFSWILKSDANYVRMNPTQWPDKPYNELVGIVSKGAIYRTSTVLSVWKKNILLELLQSGESAWDFEIYGTVKSDKYDNFYSTWKNYFPVINCVIKAKWQRGAVRKLQSLGVPIDLTTRKIMNYKETAALYLRQLRSSILNLFPAQHRREIKDFVLRGKYNYQSK